MKTRLIFVQPAWQEHSNKYFISIYKNKISYYEGLHPLSREYQKVRVPKNSKILINKDFDFRKLNKLDKLEHNNTKATHEIISKDLHLVVFGCGPYCVQLNLIQSFYLNWHFKKYIIQSVDFKKNILTAIFGVVLGIFSTLLVQRINTTNNDPKIAPINEHQNQDVLKIEKNDTTILNKDSVSK